MEVSLPEERCSSIAERMDSFSSEEKSRSERIVSAMRAPASSWGSSGGILFCTGPMSWRRAVRRSVRGNSLICVPVQRCRQDVLHPGNVPVYAGKKHGLPPAGSDLSDSADREDVPRQPGLSSSADPSVLYHGKKLFLKLYVIFEFCLW